MKPVAAADAAAAEVAAAAAEAAVAALAVAAEAESALAAEAAEADLAEVAAAVAAELAGELAGELEAAARRGELAAGARPDRFPTYNPDHRGRVRQGRPGQSISFFAALPRVRVAKPRHNI
jgi:hypothetical protein